MTGVQTCALPILLLPMSIAVIKSLPFEDKNSKFSLYVLLAIAYGSSIGGVGTLIGSPPNLQMASILSKEYNIEVDIMQ